MIIDRREAYVLAFNFTYLDIEHSRSVGLITTNPELVEEAESCSKRTPKRTQQLSSFIKRAKKSLFIYDPEISAAAIIRLLEDLSKAGVEIRILGHLGSYGASEGAKKIAKAVVKDLPPEARVLEVMVKEMPGARTDIDLVAQNGTALGNVAESK